jgi:hypothetical protein
MNILQFISIKKFTVNASTGGRGLRRVEGNGEKIAKKIFLEKSETK